MEKQYELREGHRTNAQRLDLLLTKAVFGLQISVANFKMQILIRLNKFYAFTLITIVKY